jgi:hypothetical protein
MDATNAICIEVLAILSVARGKIPIFSVDVKN